MENIRSSLILSMKPRSLEKIFTNMKLYCRLDIVIKDKERCVSNVEMCEHCMYFTHTMGVFRLDEIGRLVCPGCADYFKRNKRVRPTKYYPNICVQFVEANIHICRTRRAVTLCAEDIIAKIRNGLADFHLRSNPWRFKSALGQEDRPQLIEFLNGWDLLIPTLSDHSTGVRVIDEHLRRLNIWECIDGTTVLLAHDEVIVLNDSHFADALLNLNLIGSLVDGPIPPWKSNLLVLLMFLQTFFPFLFEWSSLV